jgi:hypothetical protein
MNSQQREVPVDGPEEQPTPEALPGQPTDVDHLLPASVSTLPEYLEPNKGANVMTESTITASDVY